MNDLVSTSYISCGCNKSPQVLDWGENNLICYGTCNAIAVYEPSEQRIICTLSEHSNKVNAVKWIRGKLGVSNELVSGSTDSKVIVWLMQCRKNIRFEAVSVLNGHEGSVHAVEGKYRNNDTETVIASAGADNTVRVWLRMGKSDFFCLQVIDLGTSIAFCVDILVLDDIKSCLLGFGTDTPELIFHSIGESLESCAQLLKMRGHEDWIRSISMKILSNSDIFIASSAQDMTVRIMRLTQNNPESNDQFSLKKEEIILGDFSYYLSLETVLFGHEGWIYSVDWLPTDSVDTYGLLTASFDRTVVIWKPCPVSGVWIEESRMGELGGDNSLGYYGGKIAPDGKSVIAYSYQGSFHKWLKEDDKWVADFIIGGHTDAVMDVCWEENGEYLLSVSSDKTTRLHSTFQERNSIFHKIWCEFSRPQIHGHALSSVACLKNLIFASCSEEKVIRVFEAPDIVLQLLNSFCGIEFSKKNSLPSMASITALGLSNKAVYQNERLINSGTPYELDCNQAFEDDIINEDFLVQHTLWPEIMKLYGHGNDAFCVSASHDGKLLATSAKATNLDQAKILLWDTQTWKIIGSLECHQLTVTQMSFSPTDTYLLSVSRDRKWCLFKKNENNKYEVHSVPEKNIHSRIIWSCAFSHDELYFVTGSRDCKAIVWDLYKPVNTLVSDKGSVTAVTFGPSLVGNGGYLIAVGHDIGDITVYSWSLNGWTLLNSVPKHFGHHLTVQRLMFRPISSKTSVLIKNSIFQLASCSIDHSVRIFDIIVKNICE